MTRLTIPTRPPPPGPSRSAARAAAGAPWTATVTATGFTAGAGTPLLTVPGRDAGYLTSPLTTSGMATFTRTPVTTLSGSPQTIVTATGASGDNSAAWTASVAVHLPASAVADTYAGVITSRWPS
jgi:hypothetical protein